MMGSRWKIIGTCGIIMGYCIQPNAITTIVNADILTYFNHQMDIFMGKLKTLLPSGELTQLLKMAIEIVDFPIKNGDFPQQTVSLPEGTPDIGWFDLVF